MLSVSALFALSSASLVCEVHRTVRSDDGNVAIWSFEPDLLQRLIRKKQCFDLTVDNIVALPYPMSTNLTSTKSV